MAAAALPCRKIRDTTLDIVAVKQPESADLHVWSGHCDDIPAAADAPTLDELLIPTAYGQWPQNCWARRQI
jgi:hypothetical protein